jgi:hypothetical protein
MRLKAQNAKSGVDTESRTTAAGGNLALSYPLLSARRSEGGAMRVVLDLTVAEGDHIEGTARLSERKCLFSPG